MIDLSRSHIWDASTVASLDAITAACARLGRRAEIVGPNAHSAQRHDRLSGSVPSH